MSTAPAPAIDMNKLNAFIGQFVTDLGDSVRVLFRGRLSAALTAPIDVDRLGHLMAGVGDEAGSRAP